MCEGLSFKMLIKLDLKEENDESKWLLGGKTEHQVQMP